MHGLLHGLVDGRGVEPEQGADAGGLGRAEMGDVVDLVLVQADGLHEIDVDLVAGGQAAQQLVAGLAEALRDGEHGGNVVAGVAVVGGQERVVHVEFAHRGAVGPGGPLGADPDRRVHAEHCCALPARPGRMRQRHVARRHAGVAVDAGDGDGCVVDHAVDDHLRRFRRHLDGVGRHVGNLPGELVLALELGFGRVDGDVVQLHRQPLNTLAKIANSEPQENRWDGRKVLQAVLNLRSLRRRRS